MLIQADLLVQDMVSTYFRALREDSAALESIFAGLSDAKRADIRTYFAAHVIPVKLGYPLAAAEFPGVYLILGSMTETAQSIGGTLGDTETPLRFYEEQGAYYQHLLRLQCCSINADATVWLQNIVLAGLLAYRPVLADKGLTQQKVGASDFQPFPPWFPDGAYRRDVTLMTEIALSVPVEVLKIVDIVVTPQVVEPEQGAAVIRL